MKEKKGMFKKIQEMLKSIFSNKDIKKLPEVSSNNIQSNNEKDFRNTISTSIAKEINENSVEEINKDEVLESLYNFYFPTSLKGYTFKTNLVLDDYSTVKNAYVCTLIKETEEKTENGLPICLTYNKEKASIIEETLLGLKNNDNDKENIEQIKENGFKLGNKNFKATKDFHLDAILTGMLETDKDNVSIPIDYLYKLTPKGYKIKKSDRLIEIERKREEENKKKLDYYDLIKRNILQDESINIDEMEENQISKLKTHYENIINNVENKQWIEELEIAYITKLSVTNKKCQQILQMYNEIEEQLKKNMNNSIKKLDVLRKKEQIKRIINNILVQKINDNLNIINKENETQER